MLVDSHCHLDYPELSGSLDAVTARAHAAGVGLMLSIGTRLSEFSRVLAVAERLPQVYCTVGVHPHEAEKEGQDEAKALIAHTAHPKVVGIGESGLDFYYEHSNRAAQERNFRAHIAAARSTGLPLVVHSRDADQEMVDILAEEMRAGAFTGVMHCFSSGPKLAEAALALGFYISLSGIVTFKKADELRAIARDLPLNRLLLETDAPFLAPVPKRGQPNEPAFVAHTAEAVARLRGISTEELAEVTTANFFRLFRKTVRPQV
ncbi:MAG: TatD family deoxyribonuclease [Alphaproteobacteria bacterium]|nr:TatD family deoxyribonuclease [Alphaproteobacteria bacterium]